MKAFNFEQRKESELQKFVGLKGNVVEWRYGYVEKKIDYTLKTQGGENSYIEQVHRGDCRHVVVPESREW